MSMSEPNFWLVSLPLAIVAWCLAAMFLLCVFVVLWAAAKGFFAPRPMVSKGNRRSAQSCRICGVIEGDMHNEGCTTLAPGNVVRIRKGAPTPALPIPLWNFSKPGRGGGVWLPKGPPDGAA